MSQNHPHKEKLRQVQLTPYCSRWPIEFKTEAQALRHLLGENCQDIQHIGSTAIPNIYAKPVIDILIIVNDLSLIDQLNDQFEKLGYTCMGEYGIPGRRFYWKSPENRTHHIHLFAKGHPEIKRHLAFRDYLLTHPDTAFAYSHIKRNLAAAFPHDIEAYVNGKGSFIRMIDYRAGSPKAEQLNASDDIQLLPYDSHWPRLAAAEIQSIKDMTQLPCVAIEHAGSTAIEGLIAKPIIDIFIALKTIDEAEHWIKPLDQLGYIYWADNPNKMHLRFFKGMPPYGVARTHHVHIMPMNDDFKRRVHFRDLLTKNSRIRQEYQALKQTIAKKYSKDREAYTDAKAVFIKKHI